MTGGFAPLPPPPPYRRKPLDVLLEFELVLCKRSFSKAVHARTGVRRPWGLSAPRRTSLCSAAGPAIANVRGAEAGESLDAFDSIAAIGQRPDTQSFQIARRALPACGGDFPR